MGRWRGALTSRAAAWQSLQTEGGPQKCRHQGSPDRQLRPLSAAPPQHARMHALPARAPTEVLVVGHDVHRRCAWRCSAAMRGHRSTRAWARGTDTCMSAACMPHVGQQHAGPTHVATRGPMRRRGAGPPARSCCWRFRRRGRVPLLLGKARLLKLLQLATLGLQPCSRLPLLGPARRPACTQQGMI